MSIKRSKQRSFSRRPGSDDSDFNFLSSNQPEKSWEEQVKSQADSVFVPYSMTAKYTKGSFIEHPKFGRGVVVSIEGSHVIVLFADGQKKLGHARTTQPLPPRSVPADAVTEPGDADEDPAAQLASDVLATARSASGDAGTDPAPAPDAAGGESENR